MSWFMKYYIFHSSFKKLALVMVPIAMSFTTAFVIAYETLYLTILMHCIAIE